MRKVLGLVGIGLLGLAIVLALGQGIHFFLYKVFSPKYEQVRHDTFKQSQAYNDGMIQELQAMRLDYVKASPAHKEALTSIMLHRTAHYDLDRLPPDLRAFVADLRNVRVLSDPDEYEAKPAKSR